MTVIPARVLDIIHHNTHVNKYKTHLQTVYKPFSLEIQDFLFFHQYKYKNSSAQKSNSNIVGLNFQIYIFFILITIVDT